MTDYGLEQAKAQATSVARMVAALECDYDRLEELREELQEAHFDSGSSLSFAEWCVDQLNSNTSTFEDTLKELAELEDAANGCEDQEEAQQAVQDDALSVEVRSAWQTLGETLTASEFCILLCTGGPAVRIVGELDEHLTPCRAWIEYQDWGTPWTELVGDISSSTLVSYASQFYFGE